MVRSFRQEYFYVDILDAACGYGASLEFYFMRWLPPVQPWIIRMLVWRFLFCDFARQIRQGLIRFPRFGRKS